MPRRGGMVFLPPFHARPPLPPWGGIGWGGAVAIGLDGPACPAARATLAVLEFGCLDPLDDNRRNFSADQFHDRGDGVAVLRRGEHEGSALKAGASGSADAVNVVLGGDRHGKKEEGAPAF